MMIGPQESSPPKNTSLKPVRLREGADLRALEQWLLSFIGPGCSGDFDSREAGDQWFLGVDRGQPTIWFENEKHFSAFLLELNNGGLGSTVMH
jgi:hypothetical protein